MQETFPRVARRGRRARLPPTRWQRSRRPKMRNSHERAREVALPQRGWSGSSSRTFAHVARTFLRGGGRRASYQRTTFESQCAYVGAGGPLPRRTAARETHCAGAHGGAGYSEFHTHRQRRSSAYAGALCQAVAVYQSDGVDKTGAIAKRGSLRIHEKQVAAFAVPGVQRLGARRRVFRPDEDQLSRNRQHVSRRRDQRGRLQHGSKSD